MRLVHAVLAAAALVLSACSGGAAREDLPSAPAPSATSSPGPAPAPDPTKEAPPVSPANSESESSASSKPRTETATFAGGCFWCMEAVYEQIPGVLDARSGFMGGTVPDATYEQVCDGGTGHAEAIQVTFDPSKVGYEALLEWFWKSHDPTTLNRQGADVGTQYRSAIFVHSDAQKAAAETSKAATQKALGVPVVTEIAAASAFIEADPHHQDFYRLNSGNGYCRAVIRPKLEKLGLKE